MPTPKYAGLLLGLALSFLLAGVALAGRSTGNVVNGGARMEHAYLRQHCVHDVRHQQLHVVRFQPRLRLDAPLVCVAKHGNGSTELGVRGQLDCSLHQLEWGHR